MADRLDELWEAAEHGDLLHLGVVCDAMEELGHPLAAGMRRLCDEGKVPTWDGNQFNWWHVSDLLPDGVVAPLEDQSEEVRTVCLDVDDDHDVWEVEMASLRMAYELAADAITNAGSDVE